MKPTLSTKYLPKIGDSLFVKKEYLPRQKLHNPLIDFSKPAEVIWVEKLPYIMGSYPRVTIKFPEGYELQYRAFIFEPA